MSVFSSTVSMAPVERARLQINVSSRGLANRALTTVAAGAVKSISTSGRGVGPPALPGVGLLADPGQLVDQVVGAGLV